ncbi:ABC transporter ATP-binding protein [Sphingomonas morindae]|uniref:ABC transporter ATP-binding protein n=1 Tax=Sphingomonas morindae TaxID=1541170 RepID=A0ABY4X3I4_9SPHN|nr:ABC transporter ATP-binding protein [Sphingomonas morindae]USI71440.1 ABC transporter ATP-binding protein [Sphingomonas morindae]
MRAEALTLRRGGRLVLEDIDLAFPAGRVTALLGPNGAGKSSLLGCLAGLIAPTSGAVTLDGAPLARLPRRARARRIGLLPQAADLHWDIDVETLVALGRLPHRGRGGLGAADRAAIAAALAACDLLPLAGRGVHQLSGGERGRALLARVLAGEPDWLLADEPLASLDPAHQLDVLDRLRAVAAGGAGVILVLHDLHLAARVADQVVLLRDGRLVAAGDSAATLTPATLAETFGIRVEIGRAADGGRFILPLGRLA